MYTIIYVFCFKSKTAKKCNYIELPNVTFYK